MRRRVPVLLLLLAVAGGCRTGSNYPGAEGPRYAGTGSAPAPSGRGDTLRLVSFNVANAERVDRAILVLTTDPAVADADVVMLQEMDEAGTRRIAEALGMAWVYYPAILRHSTGRDFGNAVLSRWPIVADEKIVLPHLAVFGRTQRTATAATIRIGGREVRVYSTHLATPVNQTVLGRRDQLRAVLDDAAHHPVAVIGGDMNGWDIGFVAEAEGFAWPTKDVPYTLAVGRWDHIFVKGLAPPEGAAGTVVDHREASDHKPVWALAVAR